MDRSLVVTKELAFNEAMSHAGQGQPTQMFTVKSSDKTWSTGKGNGKPRQYSCHENPITV